MLTRAMQLFTSLKGQWTFNRKITNFGTVDGEATIKEITPALLHYREEGMLKLLNTTKLQQTQREYFYSYEEEKDEVRVHFAEDNKPARLFHAIEFDKGDEITGCGEHLCINDLYKARYSFFGENKFKIVYNVKGPEKDYVSETTFTRVTKG